MIVVDDGSSAPPDLEAIAGIDAERKVVVVVQGRHRGAAHARNVGIALAKAPFVALLDSDDEWLAHKLAKQVAFMETHALDLSATWFDWVRGATRRIAVGFPPFTGDTPAFVLIDGGHMQSSTLVFRRAVTSTIRFDESLPKFQDWDFALRAHGHGLRIGVLAEVLSFFHLDHGGPQIGHSVHPGVAEQLVRTHAAILSRRVAHVFLMRSVTSMHLETGHWRAAMRCAVAATVRHRYLSPYETAKFLRRLVLHARSRATSATRRPL